MQSNQDYIKDTAENKERQALHLLEQQKDAETIHRAISHLKGAANLWSTVNGCVANAAMTLVEIGDLYCEMANDRQGMRYYLKALELFEDKKYENADWQIDKERYLLILNRIRECGREYVL